MDATKIQVCHNRRIQKHKVFKGIASRGKTSVDWFFGFKLHLVCNDQGELLNIALTPGNTDDRKPVLNLLKGLSGKVLADRPQLSRRLPPRSFDAGAIFPKRCLKPYSPRWGFN